MENFEKYITDVSNTISSNNEKIIQLQKEIKVLIQENQHFLKQIVEATKDNTTVQTSKSSITAEIPKTRPMTFSSKLATIPSSPTNISATLSSLSMSDKLKYSPEMVKAYEQVVKLYDYKSNQNICGLKKATKYPRYICCEDTNPDTVYNLFTHGFIDKIITKEIMHCISKLPSVIVRSMEAMIKEMGAGP